MNEKITAHPQKEEREKVLKEAFLIALSHLPGAAELTANLPKSGDTP